MKGTALLLCAATLFASSLGCSSSETTEGTDGVDAGSIADAATSDGGSVADTGATTADATESDTKTTPPTDTGAAPAGCSVTNPGATGSEPGGTIPVCCTPGGADKTAVMKVFELVNQHRAANGKPPFTYDDKLEAAIQGHCEHMRTHSFFSHDAPEASVARFTTRATACGTSTGAENIAKGQQSPEAVMTSWKNSSGHNANMLGDYKRIGIGKSGALWGQMFGN